MNIILDKNKRMKIFAKLLLLSLLASTPCAVLAAKLPADSFTAEIKHWDVKWGDTLSEIAQTLLPNNKAVRLQFMLKTVALNPIIFPSQDIHFMLAYQKMVFPNKIDGINIKQLVSNSINNRPKTTSPLYTPSAKFSDKKATDTTPRLYSVSPAGVESDFNSGDLVKNRYYYIAQGDINGQFKIKNGPLYVIEANTKIRVFSGKNLCRIQLIYGLLRVQDRNHFKQHCSIDTKLARITSANSDYAVQFCNPKDCVIQTEPEGIATLPAGLYYGTLRGNIQATDQRKHYHVAESEFYYYGLNKNQPRKIKPFKGLLFNDQDIPSLATLSSTKKKFAWGYIKTRPQDKNYKDEADDIRTDFNFTTDR